MRYYPAMGYGLWAMGYGLWAMGYPHFFENRYIIFTPKNWFKAGTPKGEKLKSDYSLLQSSSF